MRTAPRSTMRWPPPLPGRAAWSWLLGTRVRTWRMRGLLRLLDGRVPRGSVTLDVGAGPGFVVARLGERFGGDDRTWVLIDPQRDMLTTRRGERALGRTVPNAARLIGDAVELPIRSASVDLVLSLGVLCCLADGAVPGAIAETVRVLKPGGLLLFAVPRRRGDADEARWHAAGLRAIARTRPGRGLFQKTL
jgi:arsenite methyltransferase